MRILGLDYGEKRIGVAISDPLAMIAQGIAVISRGGTLADSLRELKLIINKYDGVKEIVVGLPKRLSGEIGPAAEQVLNFVAELKKELQQKIITWDERLTTVLAERSLIEAGLSRGKRKKVIDQSAAALILQSYLDAKKR